MNDLRFNLLPAPRHITLTGGTCPLGDGRLILIAAPQPNTLLATVARFQKVLAASTGFAWQAVANPSVPRAQVALTLRVLPGHAVHSQGYEIDVRPDGIQVAAADPAGLFYGVCTLVQLLETALEQGALPCLRIEDWPDYPARGVMLDVSRDKVPTMDTLYTLVDMLAGWKVNQLQLYTEHTFAYRSHAEVWAKASPLTGQDILELDAYCRARHVELVPNQNSFGHMHRWLGFDRYASMAEIHGEFELPWGGRKMKGPFSLCPLDPGSIELIRDLYDDLLPHFSSSLFNVGCDETFDLGQGRSKDACAERGAGRVYLDFLLKVYREVSARGHTMQFWGDIVMKHPELIPELPRDLIALEWGYEAKHAFDARCAAFAQSGIPFYVCPGTSTWCSIAGRTDNALANLLNAAENGLSHGAIGYLNTDWGDLGHWQALPVSYLGYAAGAAYAWALEANRELDLARSVSWHGFRDMTGVMGRVAYDLGNVYGATGTQRSNSSLLFWTLQWRQADVAGQALPREAYEIAGVAVNQAMAPIGNARMSGPDAELILREYAQTAHLLRHACQRGIWANDPAGNQAMAGGLVADMAEIVEEYRQVWLARNRVGGLADSVGRLERAGGEYTQI